MFWAHWLLVTIIQLHPTLPNQNCQLEIPYLPGKLGIGKETTCRAARGMSLHESLMCELLAFSEHNKLHNWVSKISNKLVHQNLLNFISKCFIGYPVHHFDHRCPRLWDLRITLTLEPPVKDIPTGTLYILPMLGLQGCKGIARKPEMADKLFPISLHSFDYLDAFARFLILQACEVS